MIAPNAAVPGGESELTFRRAAVAIGIGLVLILLTAVAIRYTEMVRGQYISTAVPPLPAFAAVLVLSVLRPMLRRHAPRLAPTRSQILLIYAMMTVAVVLSGLYHVRAFLPHLVALQYWGGKEHLLAGYGQYLPAWYAPHDPKAIKDYYEGTHTGAIPWHVWLTPLFWWSLFFIAMFLGIFSMVNLVQRQWIRHEKVSFPLLAIPLALTANDWSAFGPQHTRRALFLGGFAIAAAFNGVNILHAIYPSIPSTGFQMPLIPFSLNRPWTPLQPINIYFEIETIGIGYFVPLEVSFSAWFFYAFDRMFAVAGTAAGYDAPGFPFTAEQCAGGYVAIGLLLLLAFVIGLGAAYWVHLSTYYAAGSNLIPSAGEIGEYREKVARQEYEQMATRVADMPPRSMPRLVAAAGGFGFAAALTLLRQRWIGCPFHPLGYLIATASGDTSTNWFPMLIAWLCKFVILRLGGLRLYRRGMPFFLGLAIGHLFVAGIFWPVFTLTLTKEAANSYHLLFGE